METNKPFKTISLEDRLAQSAMGKYTPEAQAKTTSKSPANLKNQLPSSERAIAQLKVLREGQEKSSPILKQMLRTAKEPIVPAINAFNKNSIANRKTAQPRTNFSSTMRLGSRLDQMLDNNVAQLPKYFLSDTYSGIIKATPFITSPLAKRINIDLYGFGDKRVSTFYQESDPKKGSPILGGLTNPTIPTSIQSTNLNITSAKSVQVNSILQGLTVKNDAIISVIETSKPAGSLEILTKQGATVTNNILLSITPIKIAIEPNDIAQGTVAIKKVLGIIDNAVLQGLLLKQGEIDSSIVTVVKPKTIPKILNGVFRIPKEAPKLLEQPALSLKTRTSPVINESGEPKKPTSAYKKIGPILQNLSDGNTKSLESDLIGYSSVGDPFNYSPAPYSSPTLKTIAYDTDQLLARFAPVLKHGAASVQSFNPELVQGELGLTAGNISVEDLVSTPQTGPYKSLTNTGVDYSFTPVFVQAALQSPIASFSDVDSSSFTETGNAIQTSFRNIIKALTNGSELNIDALTSFPSGEETKQGSLAKYKATTYGQIKSAASKAAAHSGISAQASSGPNPQIGGGNFKVQDVQDYNGKDYITIKIASETLGESVVFKAYLTSFSDSFSTSWNDIQYVGRQETLKQFKGVTRGISFGLSVPSFSAVDLPINMAKIQKAINITSIASSRSGYLFGPLCKLTLGGFFKGVYCVFNSFKVDFDPAESTWDIKEGLPQLLKISMDANILGDVDGKGLDAATSKHYST